MRLRHVAIGLRVLVDGVPHTIIRARRGKNGTRLRELRTDDGTVKVVSAAIPCEYCNEGPHD